MEKLVCYKIFMTSPICSHIHFTHIMAYESLDLAPCHMCWVWAHISYHMCSCPRGAWTGIGVLAKHLLYASISIIHKTHTFSHPCVELSHTERTLTGFHFYTCGTLSMLPWIQECACVCERRKKECVIASFFWCVHTYRALQVLFGVCRLMCLYFCK